MKMLIASLAYAGLVLAIAKLINAGHAACEGCDECDARWPEADAGKRCAVCGWNNREFLTCMNPDSPRYATEIPPNATCACFELEVINGAEI
jgi:hypothetical protein